MKTISIIVPVYNSESTIERCLDSLINQSYNNIELIIIDDGSKDKSSFIIHEYQELHNNMRVIEQENYGVSIARNRGLLEATGEFIMFVDSDDCLEKDACKTLIDSWEERIDLIVFGMNIYKGNKLLRDPHLNNEIINLWDSQDDYWYLRKINLGPCNKLYKKSNISEIFDSTLSLGEDTKFVIDYLKNVSHIKIIDECLYNVYLDNEASLNRKYREDRLEQLILVRDYEEKFLIQMYGSASYLLYNEYFLDLHVILYEIVQYNLGMHKIESNLAKKDYATIYEKCVFNKKYYKIFSRLVYHNKTMSIYILLKIRNAVLILKNLLDRRG